MGRSINTAISCDQVRCLIIFYGICFQLYIFISCVCFAIKDKLFFGNDEYAAVFSRVTYGSIKRILEKSKVSTTTCLDESLINVSAEFFGTESRGFNVSAIIFCEASESIGCFGIVSLTVNDF